MLGQRKAIVDPPKTAVDAKQTTVDNEFVFTMPISGELSLTPKGIALKLDDFATRKAKGKKIFQVQGQEVLMTTLKLFVDSKETELFLAYDSQNASYLQYSEYMIIDYFLNASAIRV